MNREAIQDDASAPWPHEDADDNRYRLGSGPLLRDRKHLRLLAIFYYLLAGLQIVGLVMAVICLFIGGRWIYRGATSSSSIEGETMMILGVICVGGGLFGGGVSLLYAHLLYLTGRSLRGYKRLTLCYVMAILLCISPPLGTILGIFTLIVLSRESVKDLFDHGDPALVGGITS